MENNIIKTMKNRMKELKDDLDNTQDINKLQKEQEKAQKVIAELTSMIDELTAAQEFDPANIATEITNLEAFKLTADGKLTLISDALATALSAHKTAYTEYTKIQTAIETLTKYSADKFQRLVDDINAHQV